MAAYAMAHLKLGMQLGALDLPEASRGTWAYPFEASERLGVYLTNTLEPPEREAATMFGPLRALTEEAAAAVPACPSMSTIRCVNSTPSPRSR